MAENREILCEELINYTIYPYVGKMKDIPACREGTKEFEEAHTRP